MAARLGRGTRLGAPIDAAIARIRASYWAVPAALTVLALLAALAVVAVDRATGATGIATFPFSEPIDAEGARSLMAVVAQSIFNVTGVMFSMTIVAVSFATGKFGPRLIGNFMRDRVNQWSLGVLTATFVFTLVVARSIRGGAEGAAFVPEVAVLVALVLALASIGVVIYFVHHIPGMIDISRITASIGRELMEDIRKVAAIQRRARDTTGSEEDWFEDEPDRTIEMGRSGYVEAVDLERMRRLADEAGLRIAVDLPVGRFAGVQSPALRLWGTAPDDELRAELLDCFVLGEAPLAAHNLLHLVDQLVEITARALSPGVSDPFTAINCMNWLYAATLVGATHEGGLTGAQAGPVRVPALRLEHLLARGFGASRPYTRTDPLCDARVREVLGRLVQEVEAGSHRDTIRRFAAGLDADVPPARRARA